MHLFRSILSVLLLGPRSEDVVVCILPRLHDARGYEVIINTKRGQRTHYKDRILLTTR